MDQDLVHIHTVVRDINTDSDDILLLKQISKRCGIRIAVYRTSGQYLDPMVGTSHSIWFMATCMTTRAKQLQFRMMWPHPFFEVHYGNATRQWSIVDGEFVTKQ